jgi:hypothetical protein
MLQRVEHDGFGGGHLWRRRRSNLSILSSQLVGAPLPQMYRVTTEKGERSDGCNRYDPCMCKRYKDALMNPSRPPLTQSS